MVGITLGVIVEIVEALEYLRSYLNSVHDSQSVAMI